MSEVAQSYPSLCSPMDCSLPGSSVHGIFQARTLEWVAISFSSGSSRPRDRTWLPHCRQNLYFLSHAAAAKSLQSCPTLCDPIDGSPPGSSIPGIFQARVLEWVAIAFSIWAIDYSKYELFNSINLRVHVDYSISHLKMGR